MDRDRESQWPVWARALALLGVIAAAWALERPRAASVAPVGPTAYPSAATGISPERPRPAVWRRPWAWWKQVLLSTYEQIGSDRLLAVAAGVVFYALLAIFPAITAFVSLYGLIADQQTITDHISLLSYLLPEGGLEIVREQIERIAAQGTRLGFGFVFGLAVALWSANAGIKAMIDALNVIEGVEEQRSFVRLNAVSFTFTFGAIMFLLLAIGAVVAFPLAMAAFGIGSIAESLTSMLRWPLLFLAILAALAVLYRFGPNRRHQRRRWVTTGGVFATVAWIAGSALLSFYLSYFANYDATYGSLGAAIGLMMWMWLTTSVVLIGAEVDSQIDKLS